MKSFKNGLSPARADITLDAVEIVVAAMRDAGLDPDRGATCEGVIEAVAQCALGEITLDEFKAACRRFIASDPILQTSATAAHRAARTN